jgi:antitoxin component of MazEF toxin-antitoxin module
MTPMVRRLVKVGNSLAVVFPKPMLRAGGFRRGDSFLCDVAGIADALRAAAAAPGAARKRR